MKENTTKYVLLGLLSRRPLTGYDIKKTLKTRLDYVWDLSNGQIYPTLKALEKAGLIVKEVEARESGPIRKVYTITPKGITELKEWLAQPARAEVNRYEMLLKLIFGEQASPEINAKHINDFKARNLKLYETMGKFENNLNSLPTQTDETFYVRLAVLLGKSVTKASLEWADTALELQRKHAER